MDISEVRNNEESKYIDKQNTGGPDPGPARQRINNISDELSQLQSGVDHLVSLISPIMSPEATLDQQEKDLKSGPVSIVEQDLGELFEKVNRLNAIVSDTIARIRL